MRRLFWDNFKNQTTSDSWVTTPFTDLRARNVALKYFNLRLHVLNVPNDETIQWTRSGSQLYSIVWPKGNYSATDIVSTFNLLFAGPLPADANVSLVYDSKTNSFGFVDDLNQYINGVLEMRFENNALIQLLNPSSYFIDPLTNKVIMQLNWGTRFNWIDENTSEIAIQMLVQDARAISGRTELHGAWPAAINVDRGQQQNWYSWILPITDGSCIFHYAGGELTDICFSKEEYIDVRNITIRLFDPRTGKAFQNSSYRLAIEADFS